MMIQLFRNSFLLIAMLACVSCLPVKPGATKSGGGLYETFFVGDEGTQYFIKPLEIKGEQKNEMSLDMTFRYKNDINTSVTVNFSVISDSNLRQIDSLLVVNSQYSLSLTNADYMYSEKVKTGYRSRFSAKAGLKDVKSAFADGNWLLYLYKGPDLLKFKGDKGLAKKIASLNSEVFDLVMEE
ncbi:MAG: hypothetical protein Roseis2KO_14870 [Roseivirga sp.]